MRKLTVILLSILSVWLFSESIVEHVDTSQFPIVKIIYSSTEKFQEGMTFAKENGHTVTTTIELLEKHFIKQLNIIFVIDSSGSMDNNTSNVLKRLNDFSNLMSQQGLKVYYTVILYGDRGHTEILKWNGREKLFSHELLSLEQTIISKDLGGKEAHMEGIKKAIDLLDSYGGNKYETFNLIILMTDEPLYGSDVDAELNKKLTPEVVKDIKNSKNVKILALLAEDAYMDYGFKNFIKNVDGWFMDLSTEYAAKIAFKNLKNLFTNVYELTYRSNEKVLNGKTVKLEFENEVLSYKLPLVKRTIMVKSNLKGSVYINNKHIGYTNEKIGYYKVVPPVILEITANNVFPRRYQINLDKDLYMEIMLAPKKLDFEPYSSEDFGGFKSEEIVRKEPNILKGITAAVALVGFFMWRFDPDGEVGLVGFRIFVIGGILMYIMPDDIIIREKNESAIEYNKRLKEKIYKLNKELKKAVENYNVLATDYENGRVSYDELARKFEEILKKYKSKIKF